MGHIRQLPGRSGRDRVPWLGLCLVASFCAFCSGGVECQTASAPERPSRVPGRHVRASREEQVRAPFATGSPVRPLGAAGFESNAFPDLPFPAERNDRNLPPLPPKGPEGVGPEARECRFQLPGPQRPLLRVWYCRTGAQSLAFINDYKSDAQFRAAIDAAYLVEWWDHDQHPILGALNGALCRTPYFFNESACQRFSGYTGKAWLLAQLGLGPLPVQNQAPPAATPFGGAGGYPAGGPDRPMGGPLAGSQDGAGVSPTFSPEGTSAGGSIPSAPPKRSNSGTPASPPAPSSGPAATDPLALIRRQMSDLQAGLSGVHDALAGLAGAQRTLGQGQNDPKLAAILAKLEDLDGVVAQLNVLNQKLPLPIDQVLQQVAPSLASEVGKVLPALGSGTGAAALTGLPGLVASAGALVGLGPVGAGAGAAGIVVSLLLTLGKWGLAKIAGATAAGTGAVKPPSRTLNGSSASGPLGGLTSPAQAPSAQAPAPVISVAQPQNAPYPVDTMATAYQAAYQQFLAGNPDNTTIQILTNFDNLVQQHINARTTQQGS